MNEARRYRSKVVQGHEGMLRNLDLALRVIGSQGTEVLKSGPVMICVEGASCGPSCGNRLQWYVLVPALILHSKASQNSEA